METTLLKGIAKEYVEQFIKEGYTRSELIMLSALIEARIMSVVFGQLPPNTSIPSTSVPRVEAEKTVIVPPIKRGIVYDPMYDPAPAMNPEPVPARTEATNKVLAAKSTACICAACKKVVYTTKTDVRDGMMVKDFIDAFEPTAGMPSLTRTSEIQNFDGNIATDCPACGAFKKLYLTGGPRV